MLLDIEQDEKELQISYFDEEGNTQIERYELDRVANWYVCNENDKYKSLDKTNWDGRPVKHGFAKRLNKYSVIEFLENLPKEDSERIFADHMPKTYFVDIEVEISDGFPSPERADNPITAICIVTPNKQAIVLALKELDRQKQTKIQVDINEHFRQIDDSYNFIYKSFKSEYDLLYTYFVSFMKKFPMVSGWNFVGFDWQYMVNRAKRLGIDPAISSPAGKLIGKDQLPLHVGVLDYMELYRKWDRTVDIKENFTLDTAGEAVVGIRKVKYQGSLQDMFEQDYEKYIFYNVIDTALVQLIHNKIRTMEIVLTLANMCKMSLYKASSPVSITEGLICRKLLEQDKVMGMDWNAQDSGKSAQYAGAYVKTPTVGMHRGVACFDFASLYPSIMRQMNISPDSFITKLDPDWNALKEPIFEHLDKNHRGGKMSREERQEMIDSIKGDKIVSVTGAVYKSEESILKQVLSRLYSERRTYKKKSFEYQLIADELERFLETK